jgi:hypothetical protein
MFSNPHAQQPLQLGDGIFGGVPMQVEAPANNNGNPSTPTRFTPPSTMFSNPHAQQPLQSGDDVFGGAPMQVEDPADNNENPFMSARPTICISERTIQKMCKNLERLIRTDDDDDCVLESLDYVFFSVRNALQEDPNRKARLANEDQFKENVNKAGEQQFINLLKDIAKKKSWRDLLQNGTSFLYFDLKYSDRVLSPDVFLNSNFVDPTKPKWRLSEASEIGARLSSRLLYISFIVSDHSLYACVGYTFQRRRGKRTYEDHL